jgi:hypothetical protein
MKSHSLSLSPAYQNGFGRSRIRHREYVLIRLLHNLLSSVLHNALLLLLVLLLRHSFAWFFFAGLARSLGLVLAAEELPRHLLPLVFVHVQILLLLRWLVRRCRRRCQIALCFLSACFSLRRRWLQCLFKIEVQVFVIAKELFT